jgi:hypothetical protein
MDFEFSVGLVTTCLDGLSVRALLGMTGRFKWVSGLGFGG